MSWHSFHSRSAIASRVKCWRPWMALKIIHVMEFQILFAQILFLYFSNIRQSASPQAARFLDVAPTSGLKSCVHDFLCLHCLVFKEHCLPAGPLSVLCASQLLYNISFISFCQELFWNIFYRSLQGTLGWLSAPTLCSFVSQRQRCIYYQKEETMSTLLGNIFWKVNCIMKSDI